MTHEVQLVIGAETDVLKLLEAWPMAKAVELPEKGWFAVPMSGALYDAIQNAAPDCEARDAALGVAPHGLDAALTAATARGGALVYIETSYFGGRGVQSAGAWIDGEKLPAEKSWKESVISRALERIGVRPRDSKDAFDTIGLGARRQMRDYGVEDDDQAP
jgi:hypothetical protein